jgi:inositol hexakisphosphate/diphosphoinositol-pentakisphosphate kinase
LIDLDNTREEAVNIAELKSARDCTPAPKLSKLTDDDCTSAKTRTKNDNSRRSSTNSEKSVDAEEDEDKETQYRLDPK